MYREGFIIEEILEDSNMNGAFDAVVKGSRKKSRTGRELIANREAVIDYLKYIIRNCLFAPGPYYEKTIKEYGKVRVLQIFPMLIRIAMYAIMNVVDRHLNRRFIRTTGASIKGRGTHNLMACVYNDIRRDPEGTRFVYKYDLRRFYENVIPHYVMECFRRMFKDECLLQMIHRCVSVLKKGLSFGLRASQTAGNLLLSIWLDHYLKDTCGVKYYYRYCDDGVVLASSKKELWKIRNIVHERVNKVGLTVKPDERVFPVTQGIDFLGYVIYPDHVRLRKRIKKKFAKKLNKVKSRRRRRELIASFYGMTKHADCKRLFHTLIYNTRINESIMRSFKDLNISYKPKDGKKRFPGAYISLRELVNLPVIVKDFELGIKTEHGDNRCVVAIEWEGENRKFFTDSDEMKNILMQVREQPDGFPFSTVIKSEIYGKGKTKYIFT